VLGTQPADRLGDLVQQRRGVQPPVDQPGGYFVASFR
jgi:hypothetical protein